MIKATLDETLDVVRALPRPPQRALEVGALPDWRAVLAHTPNIPDRIGINLEVEGETEGFRVVRGDARALPWPDAHFDLVVSISTLEHIPDFWHAVGEMKRVLAPGGTLLLATPGYADSRAGHAARGVAARLHLPDLFVRGTPTMRVHDRADYYRFSEQAFREVLLSGLEEVHVWRFMRPPRVFGTGVRPSS